MHDKGAKVKAFVEKSASKSATFLTRQWAA
jgi:hypothetical protein